MNTDLPIGAMEIRPAPDDDAMFIDAPLYAFVVRGNCFYVRESELELLLSCLRNHQKVSVH
jgi:hypothetical protein